MRTRRRGFLGEGHWQFLDRLMLHCKLGACSRIGEEENTIPPSNAFQIGKIRKKY